MEQAIDFVLADELTHVRFGSEWVREFTKNDPARFERAQAFRRQVDKQFSFGGSRSDREDAAIPIAREDRIEAGLHRGRSSTELAQISGDGPSRETLRRRARDPAPAPPGQARGRARRAGMSETRMYPGTGRDERTTFAPYSARSRSRPTCASCTAATTSRPWRAASATSATRRSG